MAASARSRSGPARLRVTRRPAVDLRGRLVELARQAGGAERPRNLVHLGDPAPALGERGACGGVRLRLQIGQRHPPFLEQRLLDPAGAGERARGEKERGAALRPRGVGHLDGRRRAGLFRDDPGVDDRAREARGDRARLCARQIEPGRPGLPGWRADDPAVDESRHGGPDPPGRLGRHSVGIHVDAGKAHGLPGDLGRGVRRAHRDHDVASAAQFGDLARILQPRALGPFPRRRTPPVRRPHDPLAAGDQRRTDRATHLPRVEQPDRHRYRSSVSPTTGRC